MIKASSVQIGLFCGTTGGVIVWRQTEAIFRGHSTGERRMSTTPNEPRGKSHRTEIVVAVITLTGVLGAALFANWDKVFPRGNGNAETTTASGAASTGTSPSATQPPAANVDRFVGRWANENPDTSGITRVEIDRRLNKLTVRMWGKCHPTDCDWGRQSTDVADSEDAVLSITWTKSFAVTTQQLTLLPDRRLRVSGHTRFTDTSGRPEYDSTHFFVRR